MSLRTTCATLLCSALFATAAFAEGVTVSDAYARSSGAKAVSGAAFMAIENSADQPDRLIAVRSDAAARVELHTHVEDANGVMRMIEVEDGIPVPAQGMAMLQRGGDHIMLMGLTQPMTQGDTISLTLTFDNAGEVEITVPVDLERKPGAMSHGG